MWSLTLKADRSALKKSRRSQSPIGPLRVSIFMTGMFCELARTATSERGELEITDLNRLYLNNKKLNVVRLGRGNMWLDSGTHDSMLEAGEFVAAVERRQGVKICAPEVLAYGVH